MTKEDYDSILVKKEEMTTLIERVKKLEAEAKEKATDVLVNHESSKLEKESPANHLVKPESNTKDDQEQKSNSSTGADLTIPQQPQPKLEETVKSPDQPAKNTEQKSFTAKKTKFAVVFRKD